MGLRKRKKQQAAEDSGFGPEMAQPRDPGRARLTPVEVQQKAFRLAFRGYNERDVDEFLDIVTEDIAALHQENKRLRERAGIAGATAGDAEGHAERLVREAREEAARIIADAQRRAGLADVAGGGTATPSFLVREREFLQRLASLVQDHTTFLKGEARRAKGGLPTPEPEPRPEPEPEPRPEPEPEPAPPLEATAPMEAVVPEAEPGLSEWSNPFAEEGPGESSPASEGSALEGFGSEGDEEEEPSLRELFWGEE